MAPTAKVLRMRPRPAGPTCRMSRAKTGSSAFTPPISTGEEIERDRAEHDRLREQKRHPALARWSAFVPSPWRRRPACGSRASPAAARSASTVQTAKVTGGAGEVDQAAERRAGDDGDLLRRGAPRPPIARTARAARGAARATLTRAGERAGRAGKDERARRKATSPRSVAKTRNSSKAAAGAWMRCAAPRSQRRSTRSARSPAGSVRIGDRQEGREPGPAEGQRIAGQVIEVPADRNPLHLRGKDGKEPSPEEQAEVSGCAGRAWEVAILPPSR